MNIRNLPYLRSLPEFGAKLYEALSDLDRNSDTIAQQTNASPGQKPYAPPSVTGLNVVAQNGSFHAQITDNNDIYRGINYHLEFDTDPGFSNPHPVDMGSSREHTMFLGNGTFYFRAFSSYSTGPASSPAYHGHSGSPTAVFGGGTVGPPQLLPSQGSGTGGPRQGVSGPGPIPFRSSTGAPPIRGANPGTTGSGATGSMGLPQFVGPPQSAGLPTGFTTPGTSGTSNLVIEDTHANRLANYPPANYAIGQLFWETDRTVFYLVVDNSGTHAWEYSAGIYGAVFINRPSDLTTSATEIDRGFLFRGREYGVLERFDGTNWNFVSGTGEGPFVALAGMASVFTGPEEGYTFFDTDYHHWWLWNGAGWQLVGDSQYIVMAPSGPQGGVWYPCDGGVYTCVNSSASTTSVTTPNLNGTVAAIFGGGYNATVVPATAPTLSTNVGVAISNDTDAGVNILSAGAVAVALKPHTHTATVTQPAVNPPSNANGGLPALFNMSFWLRA